MTTAPTRLLLVDDQPLRRVGLRLLLEAQAYLTIVGETTDPAAAAALLREMMPDVLIMPLHLLATSSLDVLQQLRYESPATRVLLLGASADPTVVLAALVAGAAGYLSERASAADLLAAVHTVARGDPFVDPTLAHVVLHEGLRRQRLERRQALPPVLQPLLSVRECEVVHGVRQGLTNREIATQLGIQEKTVKTHISSVFRKLHIHRRVDLLRLPPLA
jgi:DNA-binding NarL/FixJ family response regulator